MLIRYLDVRVLKVSEHSPAVDLPAPMARASICLMVWYGMVWYGNYYFIEVYGAKYINRKEEWQKSRYQFISNIGEQRRGIVDQINSLTACTDILLLISMDRHT